MRIVILSPLDYAIVALFLAAILALGFSARLRENTTLQYIAAGRRLTLPLFVATLVSTWYGGILGIAESVSYYGLGTWLLMGVPYYVFGLLYALVFAKRVRGAAEISIPERLHARFGRGVGLIGAILIFLLAIPAAHVLMLGVLAQAFTGWTLGISVVVGSAVGLLFLYRGGLLADARVSLLAFAAMYLGFAVIVGVCLVDYPAGEVLAGQGDSPKMTLTGGQDFLYILSFFVLGAWTLVDPGFHQRVASAGSPDIGRKGIFLSVIFWLLSDVLLITAGLYGARLMGPNGHYAMPENPLLIYPALGQLVLPSGLKAVFICGMLGTILAAAVGYTLVSGATFGRELLGRIAPGQPEARLTLWSRLGLFVALGLAIPVALSVESVVALWYSWAGVMLGALLVPVCAAYGVVGIRASSRVVAVSMLTAFAVSLAWMIYGVTSGNKLLEVTWLEQKVSLGTLVPGIAISTLVLGVGSLNARRKA